MKDITKSTSDYKPSLITGLLAGMTLIGPLIALVFVGDQLVGLPFIPFDLFDWLARTLPGDVITLAIDTMVDIIIGLSLGETSSTAKLLEQLAALAFTFALGGAFGMAAFAIRNAVGWNNMSTMTGTLLGGLLSMISVDTSFATTANPMLSTIWVLLVFVLWGMALDWVYTELSYRTKTQHIPAEGEPDIQSEQLDRRQFLIRVGGATATLSVMGTAVALLLRQGPENAVVQFSANEALSRGQDGLPAGLPNENAAVIPAPGTRLEYTPVEDHYRIDISTRPPRISESDWRLEVTGMVEEDLQLSLFDLMNNYDAVDQYITLSCISNRVGGDLISTTRWTGIPLKLLLDEWGVNFRATHVKIYAADGFDECLDLQVARLDERVMLAYAWDGQPLPQANGFPLRIYIPNRYGMKQPKWITKMEFTDEPSEGYWVRRGWSEEAIVRMTSVVDTVAADSAFRRDGMTYIPIGGIAYSGAKGISKVEVQIDSGDWIEADLREPMSGTTWTLWRYDWPFEPGTHTFRVRTYDSFGVEQISRNEGTRPDGATGIHFARRDLSE